MSPPPWIVGSAESDVRDRMRSGYLRPFLAHIGNSGPRDAMWLARPGGTPGLVSQLRLWSSLIVDPSSVGSLSRNGVALCLSGLRLVGRPPRRERVRFRQLYSFARVWSYMGALVLNAKRRGHHIKNSQREFLGDGDANNEHHNVGISILSTRVVGERRRNGMATVPCRGVR